MRIAPGAVPAAACGNLGPPAMKCPDCVAHLEVKRIGTVEVDECRACGGCWFDEGELETVRAGVHRTAAATFKPTDVPAGHCPRCAEEILRAGVVGVEAVARCPQCRGIWVPKPIRTAAERRLETDGLVLELVLTVLEVFIMK
jgi:Zn-finger nucleic acid-binding protein